jgi:hypothetical protein
MEVVQLRKRKAHGGVIAVQQQLNLRTYFGKDFLEVVAIDQQRRSFAEGIAAGAATKVTHNRNAKGRFVGWAGSVVISTTGG